jgi:hypothetical protein
VPATLSAEAVRLTLVNVTPEPAQIAVKGDSLADYDGLRLLLSDMRLVGKLANEARFRSLDRLFGISRQDSALVTLVALGTLGAAGGRAWTKFMRGPPLPELGDTLMAVGGVQSLFSGVAGELARDSPSLPALIAFSVVATSVRPVLGRSWRTAHAATHAARMGFDHRYGHIFRPFLRLPPRI